MNSFIAVADLRSALCRARANLNLSQIQFRETDMEVYVRYAEEPRSEVLLMSDWLSTWYAMSWPFANGSKLRHFAEAIVEDAEKVLREQEDRKRSSQDLYVVDVRVISRSWGYPPKVYTFNRPLTEAEARVWGKRERLTPFIYPCGEWHLYGDNAVWVDESTD